MTAEDKVEPAPALADDAHIEHGAIHPVGQTTYSDAQAKTRGLEPPEILRGLTAEQRHDLETKLRRKIDLRLLPMIVLMYILNYLDRYSLHGGVLFAYEY